MNLGEEEKLKKSLGIMLAAFLMLGIALAGCSGSSGQSGGSGKKETISFIHWRGEDKAAFDKIIKNFEAKYPNIEVNMNTYPSDQYETNLQTKLRGGASGDVFAMFPGAQFEAITKAGLAEDLSGDDFVSKFNSQYLKKGKRDGKQYGLPLQLVFNIPIYNKTMFDKYGLKPPKDWKGFLKVCQTLKDHGVEYPVLLPAKDNGIGQFLNPMMMNNAPEEGVFVDVQEGKKKLTDPWWVKTLSQFKELNDKGYFGKDPLSISQSAAGTIFAQKKAGMLAMGSYMMAQIHQQAPKIQMGLLSPITVTADQAKWQGINTTTFMLAINSQSKHKDAAKKFIDFLTNTKSASIYANGTGQLLTLKDVNYKSNVLKYQQTWTKKKTRFQPRYNITNSDVEKAVENSVSSVLGGASPKDAAKQAQAIVDQAIK
jgi:raffinose/stachyose/melibiose transport system substrate-binding protein